MYQKSYMKWNMCHYTYGTEGFDLKKERLTVQIAEDKLTDSYTYIIGAGGWISFIIKFNIFFIAFDYSMLHMHKNEALDMEYLDKLTYTRRAITGILGIIVIICYQFIISTSKDPVLQWLSIKGNECTDDEIFNATMIQMGDFIQDTGGILACTILSSLAFVVCLVSIIDKKKEEKKEKEQRGLGIKDTLI